MAVNRRFNTRFLTNIAGTVVQGAILVALVGMSMGAQISPVRIVDQCFPSQCQPGIATRIVMHGVDFLPHSDRLDRDSVAVLDDAAKLVERHPKATVYNIEPKAADSTGNAVAANLARRRTQVVETYLTQLGVPPDHLVTAAADPAPSRYAPAITLSDQRTLAWLEMPIVRRSAMHVEPLVR